MSPATACPHGEVVKKTNSDLKETNNTIQTDTKENSSCRGMLSFNPHFSDNLSEHDFPFELKLSKNSLTKIPFLSADSMLYYLFLAPIILT
jgi:hypothetical protein